MKIIIDVSDEEARRLEPLARRLFEDSEWAAEQRYSHAGYRKMEWVTAHPNVHKHWTRHAAVQEYLP